MARIVVLRSCTVAGLGLLALVMLPFEVDGLQVRQDDNAGSYLEGFLAGETSGERITWGSGSSSIDPIESKGLHDEFVGEPLPIALYLNASRFIELELFVHGLEFDSLWHNDCYGGPLSLDVKLYADGRFLSGALSDNTFNSAIGFPPDPAGYGVCRFRLVPEFAELPAGTTLTLVIVHVKEDKIYSFGAAADHASLLRFPYFSANEAIFRFPKAAPGGASASAGGQGVAAQVGGLLAPMMGAAGFARLASNGRRRRAAGIACFLLAPAALVGCLGNEPANQSVRGAPHEKQGNLVQGTIEATYQAENGTNPEVGTVAGWVFASDVGQPVGGAHVAILATSNYTLTDAYGTFVFRALRPSAYVVRVDHEKFEAFEGSVVVRPGLITRIDIPLTPLNAGNDAERPHRHDYWAGKHEITLMDDASLGLSCDEYGLSCRPANTFNVRGEADAFRTILPGTYRVNLTVSWDPARVGVDAVQLLVRANHDPSNYNWSALYPRGPGEAFSLATNWEMTDAGHQRFSTWTFALVPRSPRPSDMSTLTAPYVDPQSYSVSLKIEKGTVPLEPNHPDFWKGQGALDVMKEPARHAVGTTDGWDLVWFPGRLVPPGTTWLEIIANLTREPLVPYELDLRYKPNDGPVSSGCIAFATGFPEDYCDGPEYRHAPLATLDGKTARWAIPLNPEDADPFYMKTSCWVFAVSAADTVRARAMTSWPNAPPDVAFTVIAYQEPQS